MAGILVAGTSSDAGKSLVVTGLGRALARRGLDVVPFKAQNMSNNSAVCLDGTEIGRAQYLQAIACFVEPESAMNPVLLKPGSDRQSFIVLRGKPYGELKSGEYATGRRQLAEAAWLAYEELAGKHELVLCEGAGSPAEINLRVGDYVNMGLARRFNLPVVLVGDIDRGGVLASIFGTWGLLDDDDRKLLAGYVINKFRGDPQILYPGLEEISARTGLENFGILPWLAGVWLDGEDTLAVGKWREQSGQLVDNPLRVAVVRFPRISNATDVDALAMEPGVEVEVTTSPKVCQDADLLVLPGSRATLSDLAWLQNQGIAQVVVERAKTGRAVLGICGGFQMLGHRIDDQVESGQVGEGLGLLEVDVKFSTEKTLKRSVSSWGGEVVEGYEIHHGNCVARPGAESFLDGVCQGMIFGTMIHGCMENDGFRRKFLSLVAENSSSGWVADPESTGMGAKREQMINILADACEKYLNLDRILQLARS